MTQTQPFAAAAVAASEPQNTEGSTKKQLQTTHTHSQLYILNHIYKKDNEIVILRRLRISEQEKQNLQQSPLGKELKLNPFFKLELDDAGRLSIDLLAAKNDHHNHQQQIRHDC